MLLVSGLMAQNQQPSYVEGLTTTDYGWYHIVEYNTVVVGGNGAVTISLNVSDPDALSGAGLDDYEVSSGTVVRDSIVNISSQYPLTYSYVIRQGNELVVWNARIDDYHYQTDFPFPQPGFLQTDYVIHNFYSSAPDYFKTTWHAGDTLIGDTTFSRFEFNTAYGDTSYFYTRFDNGVVYYIHINYPMQWHTTTSILYDFSMEEGDTHQKGWDTWLLEEKQDTLLPNGQIRKHYYFTSDSWPYEMEWLEGVGELGGGLLRYVDFEGGRHITVAHRDCSGQIFKNDDYTQNQVDSIWVDYPVSEDCIISNLDITDQEESMVIYPNPTSGIINITPEGDKIIYNSIGESLEIIPAGFTTYDLSNYPAGIYIIGSIKMVKE